MLDETNELLEDIRRSTRPMSCSRTFNAALGKKRQGSLGDPQLGKGVELDALTNKVNERS